MQNFNHLIVQHGIMLSFSIARKISEPDFNKIQNKIRKKCTKGNFEAVLQEEILKETYKMIDAGKVPGLILPDLEPTSEKIDSENYTYPHPPKKPIKPEDKIEDSPINTLDGKISEKQQLMLHCFGASIANRMLEKNFTRDEICLAIFTILSLLKITDEDFENFHKKYSEEDDNNDDTDDEL